VGKEAAGLLDRQPRGPMVERAEGGDGVGTLSPPVSAVR